MTTKRTIQAKVVSAYDGIIRVVVRRGGGHEETLDGFHDDLHAGDKIWATRQVNNPYLVFVEKAAK